MTGKERKDFKNFIKCWVCEKTYEGGEVKVKDHNHITVKYWGSARQEGSLNLSLLEVKVTFEVFNFIDIFKK